MQYVDLLERHLFISSHTFTKSVNESLLGCMKIVLNIQRKTILSFSTLYTKLILETNNILTEV